MNKVIKHYVFKRMDILSSHQICNFLHESELKIRHENGGLFYFLNWSSRLFRE